jgi:phenylalanyl-tRNA synthetase beta chain
LPHRFPHERNADFLFIHLLLQTFFPGRCAEIVTHGVAVGKLGVVHPETLAKFDLSLPVAAMEINLQHFL